MLTIPPRHSPLGKLPKAYELAGVIEWLETIADVLTPFAELSLRELARPLTDKESDHDE